MDTLFLIASKIAWFFLRPETLLVLLFALPMVLLCSGRTEAARRILALAISVTIVIGLFPVGNLLLNPLERAYAAHPEITDPQGIIVLGGMEHIAPEHVGGFAQVNDAAERLIATIELARRFPEAKVLFSGGKVALSPVAQGAFEIGPDILRQLGLPEERLIIEGQSRSTAENAKLARELVPDTGRPWVLVTSAWHMPRALGAFCAAGWRDLIPYPVDYRGGAVLSNIEWNLAGHLNALNAGAKEWIGLLAYRTTARTKTFFPEECG